MKVELNERDREMRSGEHGPAVQLAMRLILKLAAAVGAERLLDVTRAHIDGCLYHGTVGLEFAERLAAGGAQVRVPTTLNVASFDLLHPELYRGDPAHLAASRRQIDAYLALGCRPTWTCAPYQLPERPAFGEQVAWAESNAIVFANSVLGARTERYGDFIDICAALTGRVPAVGLHLDAGRRAELVVDVGAVPVATRERDVFYALLGLVVGSLAGERVPVIVGIESATEDQLKALGAGAATTGAVGLFHVVGVTPEAPTLDAVAARGELPRLRVGMEELGVAAASLATAADGPLRSVNLGTPHASTAELERLAGLLEGRRVADGVECYVSTGRDVAAAVPAAVDGLERAGVQIVTDTCTYVAPIVGGGEGVHMTDSAKWAYYAPANLGVQVLFATTEACVRSAVAGEIQRDEELFSA